MTNARDKTYTGKVADWGLPDGTVLVVCNDEDEMWLYSAYRISPIEDSVYQCYLAEYGYKIKSLPAGYKFNDAGEIIEEEKTRSAESTAIKTLESLGYKWNGGEYWRPPLGENKSFGEDKRYWDGEEPLEVGMTVLFCGDETKIELPPDASLDFVIKDGYLNWVILDKSEIQPVDTRTKKEKAIDEFLSAEIDIEVSHSGRLMLERAYDKWVGSDEQQRTRNKASTKVEDGILTTSIRLASLNISGGSDE